MIHLIIEILTPSNAKSDHFIFSCKFNSYIFKNDSKSNSIISSVSLLFIISSLKLLVYITRVSSDPGFKDIKLISAINCIFHYSYSGLLILLNIFLLKRDILELLVFYLLYFHIQHNFYYNQY